MEDMDYFIPEVAYELKLAQQQDEEDKRDVEKLAKDTEQIKTIMKDLNELINDDGEQIVTAELITNETQEIIKDTKETLHKARESQKKAIILKGTLISAGIGVCIGGPIGGVLGSTVHLTLFSAIVGGVSVGGLMGSLTNYILSSK